MGSRVRDMILSLNTSTAQFSIALMEEDGALVVECVLLSGSKNFRPFMPAFQDLLTSCGVDVKEIQAVAVATGPGSFTGLRVGLSVAKGICQGLAIPIIGVSSLEAMANQLPFSTYPVCPVIDSRKGEVFAALFRWTDDQKMIRVREDVCLRTEDLLTLIEGKTIFLGNNIKKQGRIIMKACGHEAMLAPPPLWNLKASAVGILGIKQARERGFDKLAHLVPSYLRPPDIRPNPYAPISDEHGDGLKLQGRNGIDK